MSHTVAPNYLGGTTEILKVRFSLKKKAHKQTNEQSSKTTASVTLHHSALGGQ